MSEYMRLKAEAEQLLAKAEEVRRAEFDDEVTDIRKRCIAWGITAADLFPHEPRDVSRRKPRADGGGAVSGASYRHDGQEWQGKGGPKPKWLNALLRAGGTTLEEIRIGSDGKTPRERTNGAGA